TRDLPCQVTVVASVGSEEEIQTITRIVAECEGSEKLRLVFTIQKNGKRLAMGYALRVVAREFNDPRTWHPDADNDVVVLMDGDTALVDGVFEKALPFFRLMPAVGAVTTNEVPLLFKPCLKSIETWYSIRMVRRHYYMQSHALSRKVLTLTGRFSAFRAHIATSEDFIEQLDRDHLVSWVHGTVRFLMGDDKSTMFNLLKNGWDMYYVPDAYVMCLEDRTDKLFKLINLMMMRWYGNMLR